MAILTGGAIEAGFRVAQRDEWDLTVCASEGCVRAVTAVTETVKQKDVYDSETYNWDHLQHSLKCLEEIPGDRPLDQESWRL